MVRILNDTNIENEIPIKIYTNKSTKHYKNGTHTFTVDGINKTTKIITEFQGCYFHGCSKCYPTQKSRLEKTNERAQLLKDNGYTINEMWECEWTEF